MCGISGIYNCFDKKINSREIIKKIIRLQHKRGPDGNGIWESKSKKITFGHNRLSIIDLSNAANQPFISNDNKLAITFNGEIYNYLQIKKELIQKGIKFKSKSDTEVVLESYKFWGIKCLNKFRGMFSFAIWDDNKKKLILARDPFGIKPLYYTEMNGVFYFASQIKSLLSIENLKFDIFNAGVVSYYLWGNLQEPYTLYKNIKSLEKGTCLIIDENNKYEVINYANLKKLILETEEKIFKNKNEKISYLKNIIEETVKFHHISDVPRTLLLSSGIDSNVILSAMNNENKKDSSALTLDFKFKGSLNETTLAKESIKLNNINHIIGEISEKDEFANLIDNYYKDMDSPSNDGFNTYLVSFLAKKNNSKIIISGIGGDEFFGGYPSFNIIPKLNLLFNFFPQINFIENFFEKNFYNFFKKKKLKTKYLSILKYGRKINSAFLLNRSLFLPFEIEEFVEKKQFIEGYQELDYLNNSNHELEEFNDPRLSIMYLEIQYYLCSKLLKDADWASMSHSLELRTPFIDWFFFKEIISIVKSDLKLNKSDMVECFKEKLPKNITKRKKTGFAIPHDFYLNKLLIKKNYPNSLRDWSIYSFKKYLENV